MAKAISQNKLAVPTAMYLWADRTLPNCSSCPLAYKLDVMRSGDREVLAAAIKLVKKAVYMNGLQFHRDANGAYDSSPYDMFLIKNKLPRLLKGRLSSRSIMPAGLRSAVNALPSPHLFVTPADGKFCLAYHRISHGVRGTGWLEVVPGRTRSPQLAERGELYCLSRATEFSPISRFTTPERLKLNTDKIHGDGAFAKLAIPTLTQRNANPGRIHEATCAREYRVFRAIPARSIARAPGRN